ncbi:MAG: biopolymer transporter ExbD [Sandaracinaceae bacterium]|jgi:biopolymer transport protein ExbD|nr:biopolymer transporter ExbD [Sandaracinaceae bacterium]
MPVGKPGKVLFTQIPLSFVSKKVNGGGHKAVDAQIPLVPFIDFLIVLVVFLLMSFANETVQSNVPNLTMPRATNTEDLEDAPVIAINPQVVLLNGIRVADTQSLGGSATMERIEPLIQNLTTLKRNYAMLHPNGQFAGAVIIMADENIDYRVIKKVMFSTAQSGYSQISFAVNRQGR